MSNNGETVLRVLLIHLFHVRTAAVVEHRRQEQVGAYQHVPMRGAGTNTSLQDHGQAVLEVALLQRYKEALYLHVVGKINFKRGDFSSAQLQNKPDPVFLPRIADSIHYPLSSKLVPGVTTNKLQLRVQVYVINPEGLAASPSSIVLIPKD